MSEKKDNPSPQWEAFVEWVKANYAIITVVLLVISVIIAIIALWRRR